MIVYFSEITESDFEIKFHLNFTTMTNLLTLDDLDKRILLQLQQNAAITNQELAEKVHASAPTCLRRVRRLTEDGWIQRQVALVQPERPGQVAPTEQMAPMALQGRRDRQVQPGH